MFLQAVKQAFLKNWAIAVAVACVSLTALYVQLGYLPTMISSLIVILAFGGITLVRAPVEYDKLKHKK